MVHLKTTSAKKKEKLINFSEQQQKPLGKKNK